MSQDFILIRTPANDEAFSDISDTVPFNRREVIEAVRLRHPETNCHDEARLHLVMEDSSIVFTLGSDPIRRITLTVDGEADPTTLISYLCTELDCRALNTATGQFVEIKQDSGFSRAQHFRDRVMRATNRVTVGT